MSSLNNNENFTMEDIKQVVIGSFVATLFFYAISIGEIFSINSTAGFVITLFVIYLSKPKPKYKHMNVFAFEVITTFISVAILGIIFNLATSETITSFEVFGSPVIIAFWMALPISVLYNRYNLDSFLSSIFVTKRK